MKLKKKTIKRPKEQSEKANQQGNKDFPTEKVLTFLTSIEDQATKTLSLLGIVTNGGP